MAAEMDETSFLLLESSARRAGFLEASLRRLGLEGRAAVLRERAELAARVPDLRGSFGAVVARSFGPPAVTAECAAPFLSTGGVLVVSEPPEGDPSRWPEDGIGQLGLSWTGCVRRGFAFATMRQDRACPPRFPRRVGVPSKRPLF
jgi:16S rRNA (guanine527-N7)-methyltransferase